MRDSKIIEAQVENERGVAPARSSDSPAAIAPSHLDVVSAQQPPMPCPACGNPRQVGARFCIACGIPFEPPKEFRTQVASRVATDVKSPPPVIIPLETANANTQGVVRTVEQTAGESNGFKCQSCGSEINIPSGERSLRCPFCDSTFVVEVPEQARTRQRPEFVIGFSVTREKALELFFQWIRRNSWFRPGDLIKNAATQKQEGVYVPFWHFSMTAESRWSARIGEYWYRTETYTVRGSDGKQRTETRTVRETEWWPLDGIFRKYYWGYMVSASKGLPQETALAVQPYQLTELVRYRPMYLAGWFAEEYSIAKELALDQTRNEFYRRQTAAIEHFLPGDERSNVQIQTDLQVGDSDLVLLPIHILSYRYRDRVFRFLVNGQTGKVYGEKPWSTARITSVIVAVGILILAIVVILILLGQSR